MPDMSVHSIENTNLKISDFELNNTSKEIHFIIESKSFTSQRLRNSFKFLNWLKKTSNHIFCS